MSVRVIAGALKSRVLRVPPGLATRPTGARIREAVFSILGDLDSLRVLDLYAGSGALGIEALSRGAALAVFVEQERAALDCIRKNVDTLALHGRARVLPARTEQALEKLRGEPRFDLVFADPPWTDLDRAVKAMRKLPSLLTEAGRLVFEHPHREFPQVEGLSVYDQRSWGGTGVTFYQVAKDPI